MQFPTANFMFDVNYDFVTDSVFSYKNSTAATIIPATFFIISEVGDFLIAENGNNLVIE